jgi:biopolymer transport protein ExbB
MTSSMLVWAQLQNPSLGWLTTKLLRLTLSSAEWVLWLLVALSVVSFAVMLERAVFFASQRLRNGEQLASWLTHGELEKAAQALEGQTGMEAVVVREMLGAASQGPDTVEEVLLSVLARERARYERFLSFLGTLGSNAPFVGLFGTVLGIIKAFNDLGAVALKGSAIQQTVMAGISEALVATAVGLGVAIPAVVAYNAFTRWLKTLVNRSQALGYALVGSMRARGQAGPAGRPARGVAEGG